MNTEGRDYECYVVGGIQRPRTSSFTEDTNTSNPLDNFLNGRVTHYHLDPYQVSGLRARDLFLDDATHDNKGRLQKQSEIF